MEQISQPVGKQYSSGLAAYPALYPQITTGFPQWEGAKFESIDMQPGSVLFIPRGTWHRSHANEDSMALSIVISPPVILDKVLGQLRQLLLQSEQWRQPLMGATSNELDKLLKTLPAIVQQLDKRALTPSMSSGDGVIDFHHEQSRFIKKPESKLTCSPQGKKDLILSKIVNGDQIQQVAVLALNDELMHLACDIGKTQSSFTVADLLERHKTLSKEQVVGLLDVFLQADVLHWLDFPMLVSE